MLPVLFEIGKFKFYSFGSFIALGTFIAGVFLVKAAKSRKLQTHHLFDTILFTLLFALLGARITYYFVYADQFSSLGQIIYFWQGGLVALGGLLTGFFTYFYFINREKDPIWQMLDIGALGLLVAWAIGKFGCFLSACTIGRDASGLLAINGAYPVDLFSTIWAILLFAIILLAWTRRKLSDGVVFFLAIEGLFLGQLMLNTLGTDSGEGLMKVDSIITLTLIILLYLVFWKLHGPKIERNRWGINIKSFVFHKKKNLE